MGRKRWIIVVAAGLLIAAATPAFLRWQNDGLTVSRYEYRSGEVAAALDGYTIVHLSDLHDKRFGEAQSRLLELVERQSPDLILLTGDMVDKFRFTMDPLMELARGAVELAPVYYVTGNHEIALDAAQRQQVLDALTECGVHVLNNQSVWIERDGARFCLFGLADRATMRSGWDREMPGEDCLCLMLAHRPERLADYCASTPDLIFSGHAHGGQVRLPFLGGLYAPGQGWFPRLTQGMHTQDGVTMVISRGLGNSTAPQRVFNRPEVVVVTLRSAAS